MKLLSGEHQVNFSNKNCQASSHCLSHIPQLCHQMASLSCIELSPYMYHSENQREHQVIRLPWRPPLLKKNNCYMTSVKICNRSDHKSLSKVFESAFGSQLYAFFDNILSKLFSEFRKQYSCQTSLLRIIDSWKSAIDSGVMIGSVATDFTKAFYSYPRGLLIAKVHAYGISLSSSKLIASYLHNYKQRVKICDQRINWLDVERGARSSINQYIYQWYFLLLPKMFII